MQMNTVPSSRLRRLGNCNGILPVSQGGLSSAIDFCEVGMREQCYLLIGYLGANNLGDECMLRQFLALFEQYPHVSFIIDSYGIDYTSDRISTQFISATGATRWHGYEKTLSKVDGVIWVGGNCFTDNDGEGASGLLLKAKVMGKRFYYIGIGTDRLTLFKRKARTFMALHLADRIIFRDRFSLNHARNWRVNSHKLALGPDLGALYIQHHASNYTVEESSIVVSWRELKKNITNQDEMLLRLAAFLVTLSGHYEKQVVIFNTDEYMDQEVNVLLRDLLVKQGFSDFVYYENTNLEQKLALISKASFVITARLHTAVAADIFAKPIFLFNYSQKIVEFARGRKNIMLVSSGLPDLSAAIDLSKEKPTSVSSESNDTAYRNFVHCLVV